MSQTNREKRKEAKRKTRERARARGRAAVAKEKPGTPAAARFFEWPASYYLAQDAATQRGLDLLHREAILDRGAAGYPDLYEALAAGLPKDAPTAYVRFGDLPPDERSQIWGPAGSTHEEGVSVFAARETADGHYLLDLDNSLQHVLTAMAEDGQRPAYVARGRGVGRGTNGEPLLRDVDLEPLPDGALVITKTPSLILEDWNAERFGAPLEDVPELARYFEEGGPDAA